MVSMPNTDLPDTSTDLPDTSTDHPDTSTDLPDTSSSPEGLAAGAAVAGVTVLIVLTVHGGCAGGLVVEVQFVYSSCYKHSMPTHY